MLCIYPYQRHHYGIRYFMHSSISQVNLGFNLNLNLSFQFHSSWVVDPKIPQNQPRHVDIPGNSLAYILRRKIPVKYFCLGEMIEWKVLEIA